MTDMENSYATECILSEPGSVNEYAKYVTLIPEPDLLSEICVQIPAYCDPELLSTISAYLKTAANPDRIHFVICLQDDDALLLDTLQHMPNCKVKHYAKAAAPGLCAARYECNLLLDGETYVMHTDSHMRAAKFWDVALIDMWKNCGDDKAIISGYPLDYALYSDKDVMDLVFTKNVPDDCVTIGVVSNIDHDGTIRFRGVNVHGKKSTVRGMFISGGFLFAKADLDREVPSDPDMFFVADEAAMNVRYFTHGYNIYHPQYMPIWHLYLRSVNDTTLERFNTQAPDYMNKRRNEAIRLRSLFGIMQVGVDFGKFGNGTQRSVESFLDVAGIDLRRHAVRLYAKSGKFFETHELVDLLWDYYSNFSYETKAYSCHSLCIPEKEARKYQGSTICVQIPACADNNIAATVQSLLYQADYPDRIHFVVCLQDTQMEAYTYLSSLPNVRIIKTDALTGTGKARHLCQGLYDYEDYIFSTDAHMLAMWHWDTMLIKQFEDIRDEKAIISAPAPDFGRYRGRELWSGCFDIPCQLNEDFSMAHRLHHDVEQHSYEFDIVDHTFLIAGNYMFASGSFNEDVPHSDKLLYQGDEYMTSGLAYLKGYHVYSYMHLYMVHDDSVLHDSHIEFAPEVDAAEGSERAWRLIKQDFEDGMILNPEKSMDDLAAEYFTDVITDR